MNTSNSTSASMAQLPHLQIKLEDITVRKLIGSGDAGVVYDARIATWNGGERVAIEVLKPYLTKYHYTFSTVTGRPLPPFDRELAALSAIQSDSAAQLDLPVVEAHGWFTLPANSVSGKYKLSGETEAHVLVKRLVRKPALPFDFANVTPDDMIRHRGVLDRLGIYDRDIRAENFLAGKLADLSACYVLSEITRPDIYSIEDQRPQVMEVVLQDLGLLSPFKHEPPNVVEEAWDLLRNRHKERTFTGTGYIQRKISSHIVSVAD